ncbi:hypothetical protein HBB16_17945, partial [Pseudonocardia sp. MCCB 268]|nr:hypothetical protein [Pseudonocardia cytotoxica]
MGFWGMFWISSARPGSTRRTSYRVVELPELSPRLPLPGCHALLWLARWPPSPNDDVSRTCCPTCCRLLQFQGVVDRRLRAIVLTHILWSKARRIRPDSVRSRPGRGAVDSSFVVVCLTLANTQTNSSTT